MALTVDAPVIWSGGGGIPWASGSSRRPDDLTERSDHNPSPAHPHGEFVANADLAHQSKMPALRRLRQLIKHGERLTRLQKHMSIDVDDIKSASSEPASISIAACGSLRQSAAAAAHVAAPSTSPRPAYSLRPHALQLLRRHRAMSIEHSVFELPTTQDLLRTIRRDPMSKAIQTKLSWSNFFDHHLPDELLTPWLRIQVNTT